MEEPNFWDIPEQSQEAMKTLKSLKDDVETYQKLKEQYEEIELLIEMGYEENDSSVLPDIEQFSADSGRYSYKDTSLRRI